VIEGGTDSATESGVAGPKGTDLFPRYGRRHLRVLTPNQSLEDLVHIVNSLLITPLRVVHPVYRTLSPDNSRIKIITNLPSLSLWKARNRPEEIIEGTTLHLHLLHSSERERRVRPQ
jgi:hypothetical protein